METIKTSLFKVEEISPIEPLSKTVNRLIKDHVARFYIPGDRILNRPVYSNNGMEVVISFPVLNPYLEPGQAISFSKSLTGGAEYGFREGISNKDFSAHLLQQDLLNDEFESDETLRFIYKTLRKFPVFIENRAETSYEVSGNILSREQARRLPLATALGVEMIIDKVELGIAGLESSIWINICHLVINGHKMRFAFTASLSDGIPRKGPDNYSYYFMTAEDVEVILTMCNADDDSWRTIGQSLVTASEGRFGDWVHQSILWAKYGRLEGLEAKVIDYEIKYSETDDHGLSEIDVERRRS